MQPPRVFYSVLNMGLGHAARSLPILREFKKQGWDLLIASNGRSLDFLRSELPEEKYVINPDYGIRFSKRGVSLLQLFAHVPYVIRKIYRENHLCQQIVQSFRPDLIFSDHCYGTYHKKIPSYFLTHQINFQLPFGLNFLSPIPSLFNFYFHIQFDKILIPDIHNGKLGFLSGNLGGLPNHSTKYIYCGILSSITSNYIDNVEGNNLDVLISISGPEPQRSILESIVLQQIKELQGNIVVVLGKSETSELLFETQNVRVFSHLPRLELARLFNRAKIIVTRSGYSTLMELVELGKQALFIPTPGQTEQLYLANRMKRLGYFYFVDQDKLNLPKDVETAEKYPGFHQADATEKSVKFIFNNLIRNLV